MSLQELIDWNPWWDKVENIENDHDIENWAKSSFKWQPRLSETIEDLDIIYVLRGPRRVGKTTLLKLKVKKLLEIGVKPENIFYYPCDAVDNPKQLVLMIDRYLTRIRKKGERAYLFIDEVSMLKDWQRGMKLLIDSGKLSNCTCILTGSHSIDIRKASESLSGRRGEVHKLRYGTPDKILLPAKFSEYIETRSENLFRVFRELWILSISKRKEIFLNLANGNIPLELERLMLYSKDLKLLLDEYLLTGGIAQAVSEYVYSRKISESTYGTFIQFLIRDISRWGASENYARQILRRIIETLSCHVSWSALKEDTEIGDHKTVESYVNILKDSFIISCVYQLNINKDSPYYQKEKKIYFQDPFIFHACRSWAYGRRAFDSSVEFLALEENKSKLIECVVSNHLMRFVFNLFPSPLFDPTNYVFYWQSKKRELDFALRLNGKYIPIEVKYSSKIQKKDAFGIYDFLKCGRSYPFGIIVSKDTLNISSSFVEVPVHLFLLLA
ncbi:MAG: ATP-binding protein [Candidatus Bathyarchaeia archaeon]